MKAALYARVSTTDQNATNQVDQLRQWCSVNGHTIVAEFVEHESGGKGIDQRFQLAALLDDARRGRFDLVVCWSLDRLSREGMIRTVQYLQTLADCRVAFHSYTEPLLDTTNELVRDILIAVLSAVAKQERLRISDRTKAGLERVKRNGSKSGRAIGRPTLDSDIVAQIRDIRTGQPSIAANAIAKRIGIDPKTVRKYL